MRHEKAGKQGSKRSKALWVVQGLLALLFLFAGGMKLVLPAEMLKGGPVVLPALFLRFIGVAEVAGALGLILPGVLRVQTGLTALAAAGLVIIMTGATIVTLAGGVIAPALVPLAVGTLAALVSYGRWHEADDGGSRRRAVAQPAT